MPMTEPTRVYAFRGTIFEDSRAALRGSFMSLLLIAGTAFAQEAPEARPPEGAEELSKQLANPISSLISVPLQFNVTTGFGPEEKTQSLLNIQPVIPASISASWTLITRAIVPVIDQPALSPGQDRAFGVGDTTVSFFLSPAGSRGFIWGAGPVFLVPTATEDVLGSSALGLGATAVVLNQTGGWTMGALGNHIVSVAKDRDREDVNQTFLQPFLSFSFPSGASITINAESTADWEADSRDDRFSVPIHLTGSHVLKIGSQALSLGLGAGAFVASPRGGPEWRARAVITFLFPK